MFSLNNLQKPERDIIRCSSGVKEMIIFYSVTDSSHLESIQVNTETTNQNITNLETYTEYNIFMTMNNSVGTSKESQHIYVLSPEEGLYVTALNSLAISLFFPHFDGCYPVWCNCISESCSSLQVLQNKIALK